MIKFHLTLSAILCVATMTFAQQDTTLIYAAPGYTKDPLRSNLKQVITQQDSLFILSLYNRKNVLQEKITFTDKKLEVRGGRYELFENGNLKVEGLYHRGYQVGEWAYYYPNKQLQEKANYLWGKRHGSLKRYWDNGQLKEEAQYEMDKLNGTRRLFYKNGVVAMQEIYEDGKKVGGSYFDVEGKPTKSTTVIQPPSYPGGMEAFYKFLSQEIKYPANAKKKGISGTVKVSFTVMPDGVLENVKVIESPDEELSREAIRVMRYSKKWNPGTELGESSKTNYGIPIKFSLGAAN